MEIQDGKGNILLVETVLANLKQAICDHVFIYMGLDTESCPYCLKTRACDKKRPRIIKELK